MEKQRFIPVGNIPPDHVSISFHQPGFAPPGLPGYLPPVDGVPEGLEYLALVKELNIIQHVELVEVLCNWEGKNKFTVENEAGQKVFSVYEYSGCTIRQVCCEKRRTKLKVVDNFNREVLTIKRPFGFFANCCSLFACGCLRDKCFVYSGGKMIGSIYQKCGLFTSSFVCEDENELEMFTIEGPSFIDLRCCFEKRFQIKDGYHNLGELKKKWSGCLQECFTNADNFKITYSDDQNAKERALVLAATFLIDLMNFEGNKGTYLTALGLGTLFTWTAGILTAIVGSSSHGKVHMV